MNAIRIRGSAWRRRLALFAVTLLAAVGALTAGAAAPAQASAGSCYWVPISTPWGTQMFCIPILYENHPKPEPCLCPDWAFELTVTPVLPADVQSRYLDQIGNGLVLLSDASVADPRTAAQLRAQAQNAFLDAGRLIGTADIRLGTVGIADLRRGVIGPSPEPWLVAGAGYLVDGLTLVQRALAGPTPDPWLAQAMTSLARASDLLDRGPATH